ncbi:MAG: PD-(D/E)XK nuclease family protein [Deltaproteobacteria bacterium]|nr:PD-(D/E)XK nuclease family protein [Deltaproteobacteria bacterium]
MDIRTALSDLLVSPCFQDLERDVRDVSVFRILRIETWELSHASLLAWLLDPRASHGVGAAPLRRFLLMATSLANAGDDVLDAVDVDGLDLDSLVVETEVPVLDGKRRFDVLVSLPPDDAETSRGAPVLLVEYKVDADEGPAQTSDYAAWAARNPTFESDARTRLPLLLFLCPLRDDAPSPAKPFVHVDYDAYLNWIDVVLKMEVSTRARMLLNEFRISLVRRDDVMRGQFDEKCSEVRRLHQEAIGVLTGASRQDLAAYSSVIGRHEGAFAAIGVSLRKQASLGSSPLVEAMRSRLRVGLRPELWRQKGRDELEWVCQPVQIRVNEFAEADPNGDPKFVYLALWMPRPKKQVLRYVLGFSPCRWPIRAEERIACDALTESLRSWLRTILPSVETSTNARAVVSMRLKMPGFNEPVDDTPERVGSAHFTPGLNAIPPSRSESDPPAS